MNIEDYIPNYPEVTNPTYNNQILHKKEYYDLRTTSEIIPFGKPGELWNHQILMSRFVSPYTMPPPQLIFHKPGTGKTCLSAAVNEVNKLDPTVRKPMLIIVPNDVLVEQWKKQIALICTNNKYLPENYYSIDEATKLTDGEKTARLNKLIKPVYLITTMEKMRRQIDKYPSPGGDLLLRNRYSNSIIIIDEAHNLRIQTGTSKETAEDSKGRYNAFHRFLHLVVNSKIMLLTGTPMYDKINELPGLMNLILPIDKQLPTGKKFISEFLEQSGNIRKIKNEGVLLDYFVGRVSYLRDGGNFPTRIDLGENKWTQFIKTKGVEMSDIQVDGYLQAYNKDQNIGTEKNEMSLWKNSRQAACFVYQDKDDKYLWGTDVTKKLVQEKNPINVTIKGKKMAIPVLSIKSEYSNSIKTNLAQWSAKYDYVIKYIKERPNKPVFIFTPLVSGGGGAIFFGLVLGLFGYSKAIGNETTPSPRYALITGDDKSNIQRNSLIEIFNSKNNVNGELIQVLIATKTISEGTSFINVREEIVMSPYWNNSGTEQGIGRGLRANSLMGQPASERNVTVQQLCIEGDISEENNIDAHMYKMSESKDFEIKSAERVLKISAWDCALNYDRNVRTNDTNESRNCDYQKCNYVCYQTKPNKSTQIWTYNVPEKDLDVDTYILYYSKPELLEIVKQIKNILRMYSFIDITTISELLDTNRFKLIVLAIEYIIENHITVYNKWGQSCYLRNEGNTLFLSENPNGKQLYDSWYARYPYVNNKSTLTEIINNEIYKEDLSIVSNINLNNKLLPQTFAKLKLETQIFLYEWLAKLNQKELTQKQLNAYNKFIELYKDNVSIVNGINIHRLDKIKINTNYTDFTKGDMGELKCLENNEWTNCDKKIQDQFTVIVKHNTDKELDYDIYGVLTTDNKFQIVDKTKEKGKTIATKDGEKTAATDLRIKYTGKVCAFWQKWQLIEMFIKLGIEDESDGKKITKQALFEQISELDLTKVVPDNATINQLKLILRLGKLKVKDICFELQQWFIKNNRIVYQ
jgi:superfamily II DNA or RNA helicase